MYTTKRYFFLLGLCFLTKNSFTQNIGNYITNGSFEQIYSNPPFPALIEAKGWRSIDSSIFAGIYLKSNIFSNMPNDGSSFQFPKTGQTFATTSLYCLPPDCSPNFNRGYFRNRLKFKLTKGETYCIKFYVNIRDNSSYGINTIGAYLGTDLIDTITKISIPLTYLNPQIVYSNFITDTLNWIAITNTYIADGTEKHFLIGNFKSNSNTGTVLINPSILPSVGCDINIDDVSCIPLDLPAYAGPDKSCKIGDSVYVGRERDFAIDPGCTWFQLPNMSVPIATASGIWVKPTVTTTYVVKQVLDCSALKYDTVVVYADLVGLPGVSSSGVENGIRFFPNPATNKITFEYKDELQLQAINIKNILGQQVLQFIEPKKEIDVSFLSSGIYYLTVETNKGSKTFKLQKE